MSKDTAAGRPCASCRSPRCATARQDSANQGPEPDGLARPAPAEIPPQPAVVAPRVRITVEGHGTTSASPQERVLVALERAQRGGQLADLPKKLPVGCRRGGCGICRARVVAGDYRVSPMSRAHVSADEEAEGVVLSCAIYALGDLTLRLEPPVLTKKRPDCLRVHGQDIQGGEG